MSLKALNNKIKKILLDCIRDSQPRMHEKFKKKKKIMEL